MKNLKSILVLATQFLEKHQVARPRFVAESLLAHFLGMKRIELYMHHDRPLVESEIEPFRESLKRAKLGEPYEYIIGKIEFFDCFLEVDSRVLIPRQETEILLDKVCSLLSGQEKTALDLCTGSGCCAIGLKKKFPQLEVTGIDLFQDALEVAKKNARTNEVIIRWLQGDLLERVKDEKFDLVICNPPYISEKEYPELDPGVRVFEPKMALVSGKSGLEIYERLSKELSQILKPNGQVFFEIGHAQKNDVKSLFSRGKWAEMVVLPDWAGHDRFFFLKM